MREKKKKNVSYKAVCLSLYRWDIRQIAFIVGKLKLSGIEMTRSSLVRHLLHNADVEEIRKQIRDKSDSYNDC